jgi:hypothetical protein
MNLHKLKIILAFISISFLLTGFTHQQEKKPTVMIFSADGRYNSGTDSLDKVQLIIDLYGEHPLIKESLSPIYQCKKSLENSLPAEESIDFSGHCEIPQMVAESHKNHRVSIGKQ